ncbi:MAG: sugar ABC transporter ATP-binding protein [Lentisphaeria bacterium]|nr:sugar ABC transporter ATP-binding protein [Lentisphaeria bacterium]
MNKEILLKVENLGCAYGNVRVLSGISFALGAGSVLGIAGENGAGKSTLVKAICNLLKPVSGNIERHTRIAAIHQEFNLAPDLTVAENPFLGNEISCAGVMDLKKMRSAAQRLFEQLGVEISPDLSVSSLTVAEKQMVEIAKAAGTDAGVLIMDEPTTVLNQVETARLFKLIHGLTAKGTAIIYISHKLDEVLELCDNIMVLRDGEMKGIYPASSLNTRQLAEKMVGRELTRIFPEKISQHQGEIKLELRNVCAAGVHDISFSLRAGSILGVAGLNGAGRSELAETIAGVRKLHSGTILVNGKAVNIHSAADAMKHGIAFLTEDRQGSGLLLEFPVDLNMTLASLKKYAYVNIVKSNAIRSKALKYIKSFALKCSGTEEKVKNLSGGNQQKVAIAKCLDSDPEIFIFDEPTRGVDVGARREIYDFVHDLAQKGCACLLISSDLEELLGMCGTVMIIRDGHLAGIASGTELTEQYIIRKATGVE